MITEVKDDFYDALPCDAGEDPFHLRQEFTSLRPV